MTRLLQFILMLLVVSGCQHQITKYKYAPSSEVSPILVLTPIASKNKERNVAIQLGDNLYRAVSHRGGYKAVRSSRFPVIEKAVYQNNLKHVGNFSRKEMIAMGELANCRSVIIWELLELMPYKPQYISLEIAILDVPTGIVRSEHLYISLADEQTQKRYAEFIGNNESSDSLAMTKKLDTALLNTKTFHKFIAAEAVDKLFGTPITITKNSF